MPGIDEFLLFRPLKFAILSTSDACTAESDESADCLAGRVQDAGHSLSDRISVKEDVTIVSDTVKGWTKSDDVDVVLVSSGTGLREEQDVTVEALSPLFEKTLDGFSVLFHRIKYEGTGVPSLQSRACAGLINHTFVFCLPGSKRAVTQAWDKIIRDALDSRYRPSSLVDLIPRLNE